MKMRLTPPAAAPGAWLIAGRSAAGAVLLAVTVSACSGGGSSVPSISAPAPQTNGQSSSHQGTRTPSPAGQASRSGRSSASSSASSSAPGRGGASASESPHASVSSSASSHASSSATAKPAHTNTPAPSHSSAPVFPTAAPETGGGGTAGLQDGLLFGVGGLTVFAGFGTLAYRRRLARKFGINGPTRRGQADREPADR